MSSLSCACQAVAKTCRVYHAVEQRHLEKEAISIVWDWQTWTLSDGWSHGRTAPPWSLPRIVHVVHGATTIVVDAPMWPPADCVRADTKAWTTNTIGLSLSREKSEVLRTQYSSITLCGLCHYSKFWRRKPLHIVCNTILRYQQHHTFCSHDKSVPKCVWVKLFHSHDAIQPEFQFGLSDTLLPRMDIN